MTLENRAVRYQDLIPCTNAFIDTRSPGSDKKENFTVIGPGVAENPDQHVHISIPHGFNIGGARQPANCLNSQHSHLTEEVFVVHSGEWDFISGVNADDGRINLKPGDIISIPTDVFRGFECTKGEEQGIDQGKGYLHAVLGGDDPGRVLWAPSVFEMAKDYGLVLLEDGSLVDTTQGETIPDGKSPMPVTSAEQIAQHRVVTSAELQDIIIRSEDFVWQTDTSLSNVSGVQEASLVGGESKAENVKASKLGWAHGFVVRALQLAPGAKVDAHIRHEEEVLFIHQGQLNVSVDGETIQLSQGDNFTTPIGSVRGFENGGSEPVVCYVTRRGDEPKAPDFI
ncbi:cupin domain-containing protein [Thalassotalea litorea]|uniref:cupin domain-containing protein n=1 Tax=Thalassotalea litorea TaxID=2020715 RepID=UPI0037367371